MREKMSHRDIFRELDKLQENIWDVERKMNRLIDVLVTITSNKRDKETLEIIRRL